MVTLRWTCYRPSHGHKKRLWHLQRSRTTFAVATVCGQLLLTDKIDDKARARRGSAICMHCNAFAIREGLTGPELGKTPHKRED